MSAECSFHCLGGPSERIQAKIDFADSNQPLKVSSDQSHFQLYDGPVRMHVWKRAKGDIIAWGIVKLVLISDRLRRALESIQATGYELLPANVKLIFPHDPEDAIYWQLLATGWGGCACEESGITQLDENEYGPHHYSISPDVANVIQPDQYDGSDFFRFWPLPGCLVVTDRIRQLFESKRVKHCSFVTLDEKCRRMATLPIEIAPAPLCQYFRPERAREVGADLGIDWFEIKHS